MRPTLSIVSPVFNEEEGLAEFVRQVHAAVDSLEWKGWWGRVGAGAGE